MKLSKVMKKPHTVEYETLAALLCHYELKKITSLCVHKGRK